MVKSKQLRICDRYKSYSFEAYLLANYYGELDKSSNTPHIRFWTERLRRLKNGFSRGRGGDPA